MTTWSRFKYWKWKWCAPLPMSERSRRCLMLLEKCKNMKHLKQTHAQAIACGLQNSSFALSRLLAFCSDPLHGGVSHGWKIFEQIEHPTICICNTMIKAFLFNGEFSRTIEIYRKMLEDGMSPDNYTLPYVLKACANMKIHVLGELIHGQCLKLGCLFDIFVGNTLIAMYSAFDEMDAARSVFDEIPWHCVVSWTVLISGYAKKGDIHTAREVFDESPVRDRGIWGSMISGYVQNNCFKEGLQLFRLMQSAGIKPDEAIFVSILSACAHSGALDLGIWIHRYINRHKNLSFRVKLGTALVDMYAKCGCLDLAKQVFDEMPQRDTICWNAMISGLAMHGEGESALNLFTQMENTGAKPDDITFIALFTACSYSGKATTGLTLLNKMRNEYNIKLKTEHLGCIIDFLGRSGLLNEAKEIIERTPNFISATEEAVAWRALLSACCSYNQIQLAEIASEKLVRLERHSGAYILLSNVYSVVGKYDNAKRVRKMMKTLGIDKTPGCSSVEINGVTYEFIAGEETHPNMVDIREVLKTMNKQTDYSGFGSNSV